MTLEEQLKSISDSELAEKAESTLNKLCKTGGRSFTMTVPPSLEDTDMIFSEVIERFKNLTTKHFHLNNNMEKLIELTKRKKELMENKNILVSVYSNASGFLYELMKVKGGTSLGDSSVRGDNDNGAFESYENALEDALNLIEKYNFSEYESECLKNEWHIGNYAYFLNEKFPQ